MIAAQSAPLEKPAEPMESAFLYLHREADGSSSVLCHCEGSGAARLAGVVVPPDCELRAAATAVLERASDRPFDRIVLPGEPSLFEIRARFIVGYMESSDELSCNLAEWLLFIGFAVIDDATVERAASPARLRAAQALGNALRSRAAPVEAPEPFIGRAERFRVAVPTPLFGMLGCLDSGDRSEECITLRGQHAFDRSPDD